jgi:hypothetical protein
MLKVDKVFKKLQKVVPRTYTKHDHARLYAHAIWNAIKHDPDLYQKMNATSRMLQAEWTGSIGDVCLYGSAPEVYTAVSVDGSQIYPDRHQGASCYMINMGIAQFSYDLDESYVSLDSDPSVYSTFHHDMNTTPDIVNCQRTDQEFQWGFDKTYEMICKYPHKHTLFLCDGSLIFWHLNHKSDYIKQTYMTSYIQKLEYFYTHSIPIIGYISMPKSQDLIKVIEHVYTHKVISHDVLRLPPIDDESFSEHIRLLTDIDIIDDHLNVYQATRVFVNNSPISREYPPHLKPCFIYLKLKDDIARLEFPAWLAHNTSLLSQSIACIIDQAHKGQGYPVALSEAHEQAVISARDEDVFYHMIDMISVSVDKKRRMSRKKIKKKVVGI